MRSARLSPTRTAITSSALPVGQYEVSCEAAGFKRALVSGVSLAVEQRARVDIQLALGAVEQQVQVTGAVPIIETDSASQGTVIDNQRIVELPLNGRNFEQLAVLGREWWPRWRVRAMMPTSASPALAV